MDVKAFIDYSLENDKICERYRSRVAGKPSKAELFTMFADANGGEFVCSQITPEHPIDYEAVEQFFSNHINGRHIVTHLDDNNKSLYRSKIFCNYNGTIAGDTALLTLLGCKACVEVKENHLIQIYCDCNTVCEIICPKGSRAVCAYWGEKPSVDGAGEVRFVIGEKGI